MTGPTLRAQWPAWVDVEWVCIALFYQAMDKPRRLMTLVGVKA